jgi:hypothetical protein
VVLRQPPKIGLQLACAISFVKGELADRREGTIRDRLDGFGHRKDAASQSRSLLGCAVRGNPFGYEELLLSVKSLGLRLGLKPTFARTS